MRQVLSLLNFHRAVKSPNLSLYLASLENLATYFFAYNRLDYAHNILEFTARAFSARETYPDIWKRLESEEFSVTKSTIPFTNIEIRLRSMTIKLSREREDYKTSHISHPLYSSIAWRHLIWEDLRRKQKKCSVRHKMYILLNIIICHLFITHVKKIMFGLWRRSSSHTIYFVMTGNNYLTSSQSK